MNLKQTKKIKVGAHLTKPSNSLVPIGVGEKQPKSLLKEEKSKIQSKLEALKAEVAQRKSNMEKANESREGWGKTSTGNRWRTSGPVEPQHMEKFLGGTQKCEAASGRNQSGSELEQLLTNLKMEKYQEMIIKEKDVPDLDCLLSLREEQIDEWRDVPVGFRIKLKKVIKEHRSRQTCQMGIEDIISKRKDARVFLPITDKKVEEDEGSQQAEDEAEGSQQAENEEDLLINSLNLAFLGRRSMMKSCGDSEGHSSKKSVKWGEEVQEFRSENKQKRTEVQGLTTKYPAKQLRKEIIQASIQEFEAEEATANIGPVYCWSCLKKVEQAQKPCQSQSRWFCSPTCSAKYGEATDIASLEAKIEMLEQELERKELRSEEQSEFPEEDAIDLSLA